MPEQGSAIVPMSPGPDDLDRLLDRFEAAWQSGAPPAIEEFLPASRAGRRKALQELVKIDLEYRWRRPEEAAPGPSRGDPLPARPRLEDYVKRFPRLGPLPRLPVDLIGEEYRVRQCWGDRPGRAEYAQRFPAQKATLPAALARIDDELHDELPTECTRPALAAPRPDNDLSQPGGARLHCPNCRQAIEIAGDPSPSLACPACGSSFNVETLSTARRAAARPPARKLGRYELGELLGTGAFGSVWQGWDAELSREVAVKLPRSGRFSSPAEEERFLREARSAAQLHHPGIVAVHDVGRGEETLYIISELVRGTSLAERLRGERLGFREAAELTARAADALDYAHRQGVVHRDVKPSNILLEGHGTNSPGPLTPRLVDFGLALRDASEVTMTLDGQLLGTPAYMSPEQVRNPHAVDGRSDVYSLGVILYELLTGELPFRGLTRMLLAQVVSDIPRPPRRLNEWVPRDLETICLKCLAKDPARRYRTAAGLAADLRRWMAGEPIRARPVGPVERLWLWARRHPGLVAAGGLGAVSFVAVTGAPVAAALVVAAVASLLFALHQARAAAESARAVEEGKQNQRKTAGALQFALKHHAQAREERDRAVAAEARTRRRFAHVWELTRAVLFDFPDKIKDAPARAVLIRTALTALDGLAKEAGDDAPMLRELALAYARLADLQEDQGSAGAPACRRKSLELFTAVAAALPDNTQAQRDLAVSREKIADLERTLAAPRRGERPPRRGGAGSEPG